MLKKAIKESSQLKTNVNRNKLAVCDTARAVPDGLLIYMNPYER